MRRLCRIQPALTPVRRRGCSIPPHALNSRHICSLLLPACSSKRGHECRAHKTVVLLLRI
jgi:hypothetical protein